MAALPPQIVAFGGGGFSMDGNPLLDEFVLGLTQRERPKVCFLPSASGDADHYIVRFYRAFCATRCEPSHVSLFRRDKGAGLGRDLAAHLLGQDLVYVGGGSVLSLMGVWRAHGLDEILREAWQAGIVLAGLSAGAMCWFECGVTKSVGGPTLTRGLGFLPGSNSVHYDGEPERRPCYLDAVASGAVPAGWGVDDGVGLLFRGLRLTEVVASRPGARAYRVHAVDGEAVEEALEPRLLRAPPHSGAGAPPAIDELRELRAGRRGWRLR